MAHALWSGAISFGLVHIPVELHTATRQHELALTMLDRRDLAPVGLRRYNKQSGAEVAWDDIVKGYEYQPDDYVVLSEEELRSANVRATQTIEIACFVDAGEVASLYYDTPYYLAPGRGGDKVYALLRATLQRAGKLAIATVVIRSRQHLCALLAMDDCIVLNTLRYASELRASDELRLPPAALKAAGIADRELQMALALVEGMTAQWQPEQYHDSYRDDVLALVERKVRAGQGKTISHAAPEAQAAPRPAADLVALLQQSLSGRPPPGGKGGADGKGGKPGRRPLSRAPPAPRHRA